MFQRQLSTTALGSPKRSPTSSSQRLFQRQATASQIISSSSLVGAQTPSPIQQLKQTNDSLTNKQRVSSILANSRDSSPNDPSIVRGVTNSSTVRRLQTQTTDTLVDLESSPTAKKISEEQKQQKKAKNKRIISRMLSISAIHTSVTGSGAGGSSNSIIGGSNNPSPAHIANNASSGGLIRGAINTTTSGDLNNNTASLDNSSKTSTTPTTNDFIRQQQGETFCSNYFFVALILNQRRPTHFSSFFSP